MKTIASYALVTTDALPNFKARTATIAFKRRLPEVSIETADLAINALDALLNGYNPHQLGRFMTPEEYSEISDRFHAIVSEMMGKMQ